VNHDDFAKSPAGKLVGTIYGEKAFLPHPLPPLIDLGGIALSMAKAGAAIGELRGACRRLTNPYILISPLQRLEAQTSSAMEGTHTTADELALSEAGITKEQHSESRDTANYIHALGWAIKELDTLPISGRLLRGIHQRLLEHVGRDRGQNKLPGQYKTDQNMIGGTKLAQARFIPTPPLLTDPAMSDLEKFINRPDKANTLPLIDIALAHYQFETIHPFADGNGRVGRMLISLMAVSEGLLEMPVLYMSPDLEHQKDTYIDLMYRVSSQGAWSDWLNFFFGVLSESCNRAVSIIDKVLETQEYFQGRARQTSNSNNMVAVVNMLFESPVIYPRRIVEKIGITDAAARGLLRQLTRIGILTKLEGYYPAIWVAPAIIRISAP